MIAATVPGGQGAPARPAKRPPPAPWPAQPIRFPRPDPAIVLQHMHALWGDMIGYAEISIIDGDPVTTKARWAHTGQHWERFKPAGPGRPRAALARFYCDLVERYGNVYVSLGLYHSRDREDTKLVGIRALFLDDPAREPEEHGAPAIVLRTSPKSTQLCYLLDRPIDAAAYRRMAGPLKAAAGAGGNSSNPLHLIRLAGAVNTKSSYPAPFVAELVTFDPEAVSSPDDLARSLAPSRASGPQIRDTCASATTIRPLADSDAWRAADILRTPANLRPGGPLRRFDGTMRRIKEESFINHTLRSGGWASLTIGDPSRTGWRWHFMRSLWYHGYPEAEIRMLAEELAAEDIHEIGTHGLRLDIDRILGKLAIEKPRPPDRVSPSRGLACLAEPAPCTQIPRARRGRRPGSGAGQRERLLSLLNPGQLVTRAQLSDVLQIGTRAITYHLAALERAGIVRIERRARGLWIDYNAGRVDPNSTRVDPHSPMIEGGNYAPISAPECDRAVHGEHTPPVPPSLPAAAAAIELAPSAAPAPVALVEDAIVVEHVSLAPMGAPLIDVIDAAIDELPTEIRGRDRKRLILAMVAAERPGADSVEIDRAYATAHDRRRLRALPDRALLGQVRKRKRAADRAYAQLTGMQGGENPGRYWALFYAFRLAESVHAARHGGLAPGDLDQEHARAGAAERKKARTIRERAAIRTAEEQAELLDLADRVRGRAPGGCVLPSPGPADLENLAELVEPDPALQVAPRPAPPAAIPGLDLGYVRRLADLGDAAALAGIDRHCRMAGSDPRSGAIRAALVAGDTGAIARMCYT